MSDFRGLIVAVSGPSGVGKGTVLAKVEELLEQANREHREARNKTESSIISEPKNSSSR